MNTSVPTGDQDAERDRLHAYTIARLHGTADYEPMADVQSRIDAGDAEGAGLALQHLYVDLLGHRQYDGVWTQPSTRRTGGVDFVDPWFTTTVTSAVRGRHPGEIVLPVGLRVLARGERTIFGDIAGYTVYDTATAANLGTVPAHHLDLNGVGDGTAHKGLPRPKRAG